MRTIEQRRRHTIDLSEEAMVILRWHDSAARSDEQRQAPAKVIDLTTRQPERPRAAETGSSPRKAGSGAEHGEQTPKGRMTSWSLPAFSKGGRNRI
ncbi:Hypothetical protein A7982_01150 [Minicystis rosea]|nr:Hypothetical protein A7982_01150 [Minicystis rosea]